MNIKKKNISEDEIILWLDDIRNPVDYGYIGAVWVKTEEEAIGVLKTGKVVFASLDHDIDGIRPIEEIEGGEVIWSQERTGYDVLCWIEENDCWPRDGVVVHSQNPVGRQKMQVVINKYYKNK